MLGFLDDPAVLPRAIGELAHKDLDARRNVIALVHALTSARIEYDPKEPGPGAAAWSSWWERRKHIHGAVRFRAAKLPEALVGHVAVADIERLEALKSHQVV